MTLCRVISDTRLMRLNRLFALEASLGANPLRVDKSAGIIYGVKIIGFDSDNGRKYLPEALKSAKKLYEGIKVNIDHPEDDPAGQRSAYDRFGKLQNIRYVEGKGLYGDMVYLKSHPMASRVTEAAERMPEAFGLSHNAQGEGEKDGDTFVVHRVTEVRHVDLVADPATTSSLSEGKMNKGIKRKLREEEEKKSMEDHDKVENEEEGDEEKDSLASKVLDALKEGELSDEEKAQAIVKLVKEAMEEGDFTQEEEETSEAEEGSASDVTKEEDDSYEEEEDKDEDDKEVKESRQVHKNPGVAQLQEEIQRMKKEAWIRRLCESLQLPLSKNLLTDLMGLGKVSIERHARRLAQASKASKPRSGVPVTEGKSSRIPAQSDLYNWLQN